MSATTSVNQDTATVGYTVAPAVSVDARDDIGWALATFAARRERYLLYANYLAGSHRRFWDIESESGEFARFLDRVSINFCPRIVGILTDRLRVEGFKPHAGQQDRSPADAAWGLWQDRRLARYANRVHSLAAGFGDAYLLIWPDAAGVARFYVHEGYRMAVRYDDDDPERMALAAKLWQVGKRYRLTLYYPDRLEKYVTRTDKGDLPSKAGDFERFPDEPEVDNPYERVPVFHFAFEGGIGQEGISALSPVLTIQDDINVAMATRAVVREYQGWPLRWAVGLQRPSGTSPDPIEVAVNKLLAVYVDRITDPGVTYPPLPQFGQFNAADLEPFSKNIADGIDYLCAVTSIPPHLLHKGLGTPPSGEALRTAEAPLASRVEDTQTDFGDVWEQAIPFALRVEGNADAGDISTQWRSAYTRAEKDQAETLGIKRQQLSVPLETVWSEAGYSDQEILTMREQLATEQAGDVAGIEALAAAARGQQGNGQVPPDVAAELQGA